MQVEIDREACVGCNACVEDCPDVFSLDGDSKAVLNHAPWQNQEQCTRHAADDCPTDAILLQ
ncbi:ferredoxin [Ruminococcaceae bacterium OttesenSCG-928-I18]|nr:ferredoxin [Ruminococcaceae bacterium OttesenSCG-928-I18]